MTAIQAVEAAGRAAVNLNWPWDAASATAKRRRFWPLPEYWVVVCRVETSGAIVTMRVYQRSCGAYVVPVRVLYRAGGPGAKH